MGRLESLLHRNLRFVRAVTDDLTIVLLAFPGPADSSKPSILTWRRLDTASSRPVWPKSKSLSALLFADLFDDHRQVSRYSRKNRDKPLRLTINKEHYLRDQLFLRRQARNGVHIRKADDLSLDDSHLEGENLRVCRCELGNRF